MLFAYMHISLSLYIYIYIHECGWMNELINEGPGGRPRQRRAGVDAGQ